MLETMFKRRKYLAAAAYSLSITTIPITKFKTRNNILHKISGSGRRVNATILRCSALALWSIPWQRITVPYGHTNIDTILRLD